MIYLYIVVVLQSLAIVLLLLNEIRRRRIKKQIFRSGKRRVMEAYVDYINVETLRKIRVFPSSYENEALEGVTSNNVLEKGFLVSDETPTWMYYLISL